MLFRRFFPKKGELLEQGTNYSFEGRFVDTLSFNHFTKDDFMKLQQIYQVTIQPLHRKSLRDRVYSRSPCLY